MTDSLSKLGVTWVTVNMEMLESAGVRGVDAQLETLARIREAMPQLPVG